MIASNILQLSSNYPFLALIIFAGAILVQFPWEAVVGREQEDRDLATKKRAPGAEELFP